MSRSFVKFNSNVKFDQHLAPIVPCTAQYLSFKTRIEILDCLGMSIDTKSSMSCVRVKAHAVNGKNNAFQNRPLSYKKRPECSFVPEIPNIGTDI